MSAEILISYRRSTNSKDARALYERLRTEFGSDSVVMDVGTIPPGEDFVRYLKHHLTTCRALLALVGPGWADVKGESGRRRLFNKSDYVRLEIATALRRRITVVPVLLDGAALPTARQLPDDLKPLVHRNAIQLDFSRFDTDVAPLLTIVKAVVAHGGPPARRTAAGDVMSPSQQRSVEQSVSEALAQQIGMPFMALPFSGPVVQVISPGSSSPAWPVRRRKTAGQ